MNQEVENQIGGAEATTEQNQEAAKSAELGNDAEEGLPQAPAPTATESSSDASVDGETVTAE